MAAFIFLLAPNRKHKMSQYIKNVLKISRIKALYKQNLFTKNIYSRVITYATIFILGLSLMQQLLPLCYSFLSHRVTP